MVVVDSSFVIALHNARDIHHARARRGMEQLVDGQWGPALLPEYVFLEVTTVLAARVSLATAVTVGEALLQARELELVPCSDIFLDAFSVFRRQTDPRLSFTDAAIVAVARRAGATRVATFDSDFEGLEGLALVPAER